MVTLGVDSHKRSHTVAAVDENGRKLVGLTVAATDDGHRQLLGWSRQWSERRWALEDCRAVSRRLERDLLVAGEAVLRVPPKLMADTRRLARGRGKSDPIDALAVARAALREPFLPVARLDGSERELRLLVDHREALIRYRTQIQNRLRWHLHEIDPELEIEARSLDRAKVLASLAELLASMAGTVAALAAELVQEIAAKTGRINELERQIGLLAADQTPALLGLEGCGALTAAKIVGEVAGITRFRSSAAFAMHGGTAPIPASSGNSHHYRHNRGGNRQLNAAIYRIALTQIRPGGRGRAYYEKRIVMGNSRREAQRALRRHIANEIYRRLLEDHSRLAGAGLPTAG